MRFWKGFFYLSLLVLSACSGGSDASSQGMAQVGQVEIHYALACQGNVSTPTVVFDANSSGYTAKVSTDADANATGVLYLNQVPLEKPLHLSSSTVVTCDNGDQYGYRLTPNHFTVNDLGEVKVVQATPVLKSTVLTIQDGGV